MANFYVTYGFGSNLKNCYSTIQAEDYTEARIQIDKVTQGKFAFCYDEKEFCDQAEEYGLTEVSLQPQEFPQ